MDFGNELPACSCQNHNLALSILGDAVKGIDKLRMILCRESERPAVGVKFGNQNTVRIPRELQTAIGIEVVRGVHSISLFVSSPRTVQRCKSSRQLHR